MSVDVSDLQKRRSEFLKLLYDVTQGDEQRIVTLAEIGRSLGFDTAITQLTYRDLVGDGFVERKGLGGIIGITHEGVRAVESLPAFSASMLVEGYCNDFIQLAASLAQTLEQISMLGLSLDGSRQSLERVERGMRELSDAIASLLQSTDRPHFRTQPLDLQAAVTTIADHPVPQDEEANSSASEDPIGVQGMPPRLPLTSVFQFLGRMRNTGTLSVKIGSEDLSFELVDGCVESTMTNHSPTSELLGNLLVEKGFVTEDQIARILPRHEHAPHHVGLELVRAGLITDGQLEQALEEQALRRIRRATSSKLDSYAFHDGRRSPGYGDIKLRLPLRHPHE